MDKATFDDYVKNRYEDQMKYYDSAAGKNQKRYRTFQWTLIILSAMTPVIAALNGSWANDGKEHFITANHLQIILVTVSSIVAILTTGLKTFQYQDLWTTYRTTYEQLKPEIYYYEFGIGPYGKPGVDKESLFVEHVEAILNKEHVHWPPANRQSEESEKQKPEGTENKTQ